jgi:hypothetical protein
MTIPLYTMLENSSELPQLLNTFTTFVENFASGKVTVKLYPQPITVAARASFARTPGS